MFHTFVVIHTVKGFRIVNEAKVEVFLEFSCFFDDPVNVGNLISGSSAFYKSDSKYLSTKYLLITKKINRNFSAESPGRYYLNQVI